MSSINLMRRNPLENRLPPPLVFIAIAASMAGAAAFLPASGLAGATSLALAAMFFALAGLTGPPAVFKFRRAATTIDPVHVDRASSLVTDGVYRWTRNPMYLAMASLLAALVCFTAQPLLAVGPLAFVWFITLFQIAPEERAMRQRFGSAYETYCASTRRWL